MPEVPPGEHDRALIEERGYVLAGNPGFRQDMPDKCLQFPHVLPSLEADGSRAACGAWSEGRAQTELVSACKDARPEWSNDRYVHAASAEQVLPPMWGSWAGRSEASFRFGVLSAHVGSMLYRA